MALPLVAEDLYRFRWIDHVRLSRDGERVAYQVGWADPDARQNRSRVVVRRLTDPEPVEPTGGVRRDHSPEWSPDGRRLAFVSRVVAADQVFVTEVVPSGLTKQLTTAAEGIASPTWSPDGKWIAYVSAVLSEPDAVLDDTRPPDNRERMRRAPVVRIARRLDYEHDGRGFTDGRYFHLFVVPSTGGEAKQLTSGSWDVTGFDWSPDSTRLVVSGNSEPDADRKRELNLYVVDLDARRRTLGGGFNLSAPAWSPKGDLIAFVAATSLEAGMLERLWVVPLTGAGPRCLTASFDQAVVDGLITDMRASHAARIAWAAEGDRIYFLSSGPGVTGICSVDLSGIVHQEVGGPRRIYDFDVAPGMLAFCAGDPTTPGELHTLKGTAEARLTDLNPWLHDRYVATPERHHFTAADGLRIEGWLLKPQGLDANRLHPFVLQIHGGPHSQYGWAFFHEFQVLVGMGYVVFYANPRGSDGYGERFRREVVHDWAGKDYFDLMTAVDQIISRTGYIDPVRLGVAGGSYGGYMTNWIISQTDRFASAVAMRSVTNLVSWYPQNDIVPWAVAELGAPPWPNLDEVWRRSPIRYVNNVQTPLLLTCGEMDLRCAISQSEEMFGAMRLLGKTVEMVRFPEESHDLSRNGRPDRRVERLRRIAGWFERFLGTNSLERPSEPSTEVMAIPAQAPDEWVRRLATPTNGSPAAPAPVMTPPSRSPFERTSPPPMAAPLDETTPRTREIEPAAPPPLRPAEIESVELADAVNLHPELLEAEPLFSPEPAPMLFTPAPAEPLTPAPPLAETPAPETPAPEPLLAESPIPYHVPMTPTVVPAYEPAPPAIPQAAVPTQGSVPIEAAPAPSPAAVPAYEPAAPAPPQPQPVAPDYGLDFAPRPGNGPNAPSPVEPPLAAPAMAPQPPERPPAPAAPMRPEPQPAVASAFSTQPGAAGVYTGVESTIIAWPSVQRTINDRVAAAPPEAVDEATSIIPVWRHPGSPGDSTRTVSLQAVPPEEIAAGRGFAARLTFETGPFAGRVVALPTEMVTIGRALDNDIVVGDPATSAHHGRIEMRTGVFWISDLGSTNGTLVNGEPVIDKQLGGRDLIAIGQNTIRFNLE